MMNRVTAQLAVSIFVVVFLAAGLRELRAQAIDWTNPVVIQEMQSFKQFLANHPWIAGKLRENPSLANDQGFLRRSPELPQFLNAHPFIQSNFKIDASDVMSRVQQGDLNSPNNSVGDQEMRNFKHFLSIHPWINGKLGEKPALANDKGFLRGNRVLEEFLNSHPSVQAQLRADPSGFMQRVQALAEAQPGADDPHAADFDALKLFLQNHKWIADQLKEDPTRANDKGFLNKSKELREFLEAHPYLQDQFKQDARHTIEQTQQPAGDFL